MIDLNDYIVKSYTCKKTGKSKPQKWVMHYCTDCGKKRSYLPRTRVGRCASCAAIGKKIPDEQRIRISKSLMGNTNHLGHSEQSRKTAIMNMMKTVAGRTADQKRKHSITLGAAKLGISVDQYTEQREYIARRRRLARNIRSNIWNCLNGKTGQLRHVSWSIDDLITHLENNFQPGMSWDNYGRKAGIRCWEVDHIIPINARNDLGEYIYKCIDDPCSEDFKKCWSLDNLQPMWADENNRKNNSHEG